MIIGLAGACRCDELINLKTSDVEDVGSAWLVKISYSKTGKGRSFTVIGQKYLSVCRKYAALRPKEYDEDRFFIKFQNGRCQRSVVGIHKISGVAKEVAKFLTIPNFQEYTGHSLRRTSATFLVDSGGDVTCLKRLGGWKSSTVAEGYIEESTENQKSTARKIFRLDKPSTSTHASNSCVSISTACNNLENAETIAQEINCQDTSTSVVITDITKTVKTVDTVDSSGLCNINSSCTNCTFNITINQNK